jgi:Zn finger protein HypA/HybF involved in hydrogenase expression
MGASLVVRHHNYCDRATLAKWVQEESSRDAFENGSSYSGHWNMCSGLTVQENRVFDSIEAAQEYISDHQEKWGPLLAVPAWQRLALPLGEAQKDAKWVELKQQLKAAQELVWGQERAIVKRAKEAKSQFKGCGHCESKVSLKHVHATRCPVCGQNLLRTPTDDKQLESWKSKVTALEAKVSEREQKLASKLFKTSDPTMKVWVVGGWCAS